MAMTTFEKGFQQGFQQGLHQGQQQGLRQSQEQGQRSLLQKQLEARFGSLDPGVSSLTIWAPSNSNRWRSRC